MYPLCVHNSDVYLQTTLYEAGKDDLEREFRQLLTSHSKPLTAITILNVLAAEEGNDQIQGGARGWPGVKIMCSPQGKVIQ